jgi:hypothetical protein
VLPKNLISLGELAFYNCKSLTSIEIPPKVISVEKTVFMGCESLKTIFCYENTKLRGDYFVGCDSLTSLSILDSKTGEVLSEKRIVMCDNGLSVVKNIR